MTSCAPPSRSSSGAWTELVREQLNGATPSLELQEPPRRPGPTPKSTSAERRCNRCQEVKPAGEYAPGRGTCRSCRREQQREHDRRAAIADEEPHPAAGSQDGHKSQRRLDSDNFWHERRRRLIREARVTTEEIGGRTFVIRHLPPQFEPPGLAGIILGVEGSRASESRAR